MKFIVPIFLLVIFVSCEKPEFEHSDEKIYFPCTCCEYSDSLEGTYEAHILEIEFDYFAGGSLYFDTILDTNVLFSVTKIWQNQNYIEDSTICKFSIPEFFNEPISITENTGYFFPQVYGNQKFNTDSTLVLKNFTTLSQFAHTFPSYIVNATKQ